MSGNKFRNPVAFTLNSSKVIAILFLAVNSFTAFSQEYKFKNFREPEGLNNRFIYSIDQDRDGYLMIGTGDGLYRYDGLQFKVYNTEDSLSEKFVTCSFCDKNGNIWYGHNNGSVTVLDDKGLHSVELKEAKNSRISAITEDNKGSIWIATQTGGLLELPKGKKTRTYQSGLENIYLYSIYIDKIQNIWLGSESGMICCEVISDGKIKTRMIPELEGIKIQTIIRSRNGNILAGSDDMGIYEIASSHSGYSVIPVVCKNFDLSVAMINDLQEGENGDLWVSTNDQGLLRLSGGSGSVYEEFRQYQDNASRGWSVSTCFIDREKNIWIGTQGEGLFRSLNEYFTMYKPCTKINDCEIYAFSSRNDSVWSASDRRIFLTHRNPGIALDTIDLGSYLGDSHITSLYCDNNRILWIGSSGAGLFTYRPDKKNITPIVINDDQLSRTINCISGHGEMILVATGYGMYQLQNGKIVSHISITSGLSHNVVSAIYRDSNKRIWLGTPNEITFIEDGIITHVGMDLDIPYIEPTCFTEDGQGAIWIGTNGAGVIRVINDSLHFINKSEGLYSAYCNSIICDRNNKIWVGHRGGITKLDVKTEKTEVFHPGHGNDLLFHRNAICGVDKGIILFGTSEGILQYNPELDVINPAEPIVRITGINISDSLYNYTDQIELGYGRYQVRIDFIGISLKNTEQVKYQYILEGFDKTWSDITSQSSVKYNQLSPGEYVFKVRAFNSDGIGGNVVKEMRLFIDYPIWQKWWFLVAVVCVVFMIVRYIVVRRERFLRENQVYLQTELTARTLEVVSQKEQLESKNKDITDSILYAKNIQKAMLPAPDSLSQVFSESFVFYKPRDIVSGDFYWVEKFGNKVLVACADCTGHGVPGAFMSLIGSTLLKEVARTPWVQSPDVVLSQLDIELRNMLQRENSKFGVEDGIDISIVEYDEVTHQMRAASANRPVVVYYNGKRTELKGDRYQVGGGYDQKMKTFKLHKLQLHPGDVIYMFSDGFTDQFGGSEGRKMKRSGLFKILDDVFHHKMDEQRKIIRENFFSWKGELPQIDDIILVGIRI